MNFTSNTPIPASAVFPLPQQHPLPPMAQSAVVSLPVETARGIGISLLANVVLLDALNTLDTDHNPINQTERMNRTSHRIGLNIAIKKSTTLIQRVFQGYVKLPDNLETQPNITMQQLYAQRIEVAQHRAALRRLSLNPTSNPGLN